MASCSTYLANKILDHVNGIASYTMPTQLWLALAEVDFTAAGSGTELSGGSYGRVAWNAYSASSGATSNNSLLVITNMPACDLTHLSLWDDETAGNMLIYGAFDATVTLASGENFAADAGDLDLSLV